MRVIFLISFFFIVMDFPPAHFPSPPQTWHTYKKNSMKSFPIFPHTYKFLRKTIYFTFKLLLAINPFLRWCDAQKQNKNWKWIIIETLRLRYN